MINLKKHFIAAFCFFAVFCFCGELPAVEYDIWPVDADPALTSSFCEYRPGHFHSGIDLKVWGQVGLPCRAIEDGCVSRLKVTPGGYGRALYLTLKDGNIAVYAHLDGFSEEIEEIVAAEQHKQNSFSIELYFEEDSLKYKKGEIVAYSGQSGVKHPHVHFEIRDSNQRPLNPLLNGFRIKDTISPTPLALAITPLDGSSTVECDAQTRVYRPLYKHHDGTYRTRDPIGAAGKVGVSARAYDKADMAENPLAVYKIEMYVNDDLKYKTEFDQFSFSETRLMEVERNFRLKRNGWGVFHRLFHAAGNDLELCDGNGIIDIDQNIDDPVEVKLILSDVYNNSTEVRFLLVSDKIADDSRLVGGDPIIHGIMDYSGNESRLRVDILDKFIRIAAPPGIKKIHINSSMNYFGNVCKVDGGGALAWIPPDDFDGKLNIETFDKNDNVVRNYGINLYPVEAEQEAEIISYDDQVKISLSDRSLYTKTWLRIIPDSEYEVENWVKRVYRVEPADQPLKSEAWVGIAADGINEEGWGLYYYDRRRGWTFLDKRIEDGYFTSSVLSWERFGLMRDTDKPDLRILGMSDSMEIENPTPKFIALVKDETSGISSDGLKMKIDGNEVPAEYDPPRDLFKYTVWKPLAPGEHQLEVYAEDQAGNSQTRKLSFSIKP